MKTKKASKLIGSLLAIVTCFTMLIGSTFAFFTDSSVSGSNVIQSGNIDLGVEYTLDGEEWKDLDGATDLFQKGLWEPGHTEVVALKIKNQGSLAIKYVANINIIKENIGKNQEGNDIVLSDMLEVSTLVQQKGTIGDIALMLAFNGENSIAYENTLLFKDSNVLRKNVELLPSDEHYLIIKVDMPETIGSEFNHNGIDIPNIEFGINVLATQFTYENDTFGNNYDNDAQYPTLPDRYSGIADYSWYDPNATEYYLDTAEEFVGFSNVLGGNAPFQALNQDNSVTTVEDFSGKKVYLNCDVDLSGATTTGESFAPVGSTGERDDRNRLVVNAFKGTFDGQGHTISNLYQSGWDFGYEWGQYGSLGLFAELESATVKNLNISGMEAQVEGGDISFIAGSATGDCLFENITISDSVIGTFNNGCGGIIGWSGEGNYTFKNITLKEDVVLGGLWGSFDSSIGGIVGQAEVGATYNFVNVDVACRIDAYNDCTASYDYYNYRMCGMLIGRLEATTEIDGVNYPDVSQYDLNFENVTVTYGDWANYHYCRAEGARAIRVEAGYAYGGIAEDYDHANCTVHHNELIAFDQIFGGDQYAVKGLKAIDGVNVVYNNQ